MTLAKLPPEERQKRLLQGAKAEGELVWYTNTGLENAANYIAAFKQAYPFINAKFWRGKSRDVTQRLVTEARAGHFYADVFKTTTDLLPAVIDRNLIGRYESPIRASYPPHAKGLLWTNINYAFRVFGFNPRKLKREAVPKSWEELLQPRWKEEILFDESSLEEVITFLAVWGRNRTVDYLRRLGDQKPLIRRGRDTIAQLLMAGEGQFGPIGMGGMFTLVKIRERITTYDDPGHCENPAGTVESRFAGIYQGVVGLLTATKEKKAGDR